MFDWNEIKVLYFKKKKEKRKEMMKPLKTNKSILDNLIFSKSSKISTKKFKIWVFGIEEK